MCTLGALAYLDGSKVGYDSFLAGCKKMASRPGTIDASKAFCKKQKVNENFCSSCRTCANVTASDPRVQIRATDSGRQSAQSTQRRPLHGVAAERGPHAASVPQFFENMHVHIISHVRLDIFADRVRAQQSVARSLRHGGSGVHNKLTNQHVLQLPAALASAPCELSHDSKFC